MRENELSDTNDLLSYIESFHPIIYIKSNDIFYSKKLIKNLNDLYLTKDNITIIDSLDLSGDINDIVTSNNDFESLLNSELYDYKNKIENNNKETRFLIFYDINDELNKKNIALTLKSIVESFNNYLNFSFYVFIISNNIYIPDDLKQYISIFEPSLLSDNDIKNIIYSYKNIFFNDDEKTTCISYLRGLSELEVYRILNLCFQKQGYLDSESLKIILSQKKQIIKKSNILELVEVEGSINLDSVGGIGDLKKWIEKKKNILDNFEKASKNYGVIVPKGIILHGIPGGGKSLFAKATSNYFKYPLLKMEMNRILGRFVGESEQNFQKALELAESVSPCILWIDEIDKVFDHSNNDSNGVMNRIFGQFLTWLQEKKSNVFVITTANSIKNFPPEFLRKGRFDIIFEFKHPTENDIKEIFGIKIRNNFKFFKKNTIKEIIAEVKKFDFSKFEGKISGADIEYIVNSAIEEFFIFVVNKSDLTEEDKKNKFKAEIENALNRILKG
jgi:ATP-dependent 26S proteasome regulatory subunit